MLEENLPAGAIFVTAERVYLNRAAEELTAYSREELSTLDAWFSTLYPDQVDEVRALYEQQKAAGFPDTPVVPILRKDESVRHVEFVAYGWEAGEIWLLHDVIVRHETERRLGAANSQLEEQMRFVHAQAALLEQQKAQLEEANARLAALATIDGLTGLNNHRAFQERLTAEWARAQRTGTLLSVLLLDIDHFKQYNDSFGHPEGDRVLQRVAETLKAGARGMDFMARYGDEEFIVLLPNTDRQGAIEAAERLGCGIEQQEGNRRVVTASVGLATLASGTSSVQELVEAADQALYASKRAGRNCVIHADATTPDSVKE